MTTVEQEMARGGQLQQEIWSRAVVSSRGDSSHDAARLLLPAINEMMDVTTSREIALHTRLPNLIFGLLILIALLSGLLAGHGMAKRQRRSRFHALLFAGAIALTVYVVLDLDNPSVGLIRLDRAENALVQLREGRGQLQFSGLLWICVVAWWLASWPCAVAWPLSSSASSAAFAPCEPADRAPGR